MPHSCVGHKIALGPKGIEIGKGSLLRREKHFPEQKQACELRDTQDALGYEACDPL